MKDKDNVVYSYGNHRRSILGLKALEEDEEVVQELLRKIKEKGLTVDRASRVLQDAQTIIPLLAKLD